MKEEQLSDDLIGFKEDPLARDIFSLTTNAAYYTGYRFSAQREVLKYELELGIR